MGRHNWMDGWIFYTTTAVFIRGLSSFEGRGKLDFGEFYIANLVIFDFVVFQFRRKFREKNNEIRSNVHKDFFFFVFIFGVFLII